ncbi:Uncharacterised protein [Mycobacterium tuberculosis]|nr:Uncharacterised protein [Mycobacterium tuberculosis]
MFCSSSNHNTRLNFNPFVQDSIFDLSPFSNNNTREEQAIFNQAILMDMNIT